MTINHYDLSRILGSQIVGNVPVGHGQLEAGRTRKALQEYSLAIEEEAAGVDVAAVCEVFVRLRSQRGDRRSSDLYLADDVRNRELVQAWKNAGIKGSVRQLNHVLMNARKQSLLKGLDSVRYEIAPQVKLSIQFVCEMVATQMRYEKGASVDDIICDPVLSQEYHSRCTKIVPGYTWLDYRWTMLSVRKAGRHQKLAKKYKPLDLTTDPFTFTYKIPVTDVHAFATLPSTSGVFSISEGERELYISRAMNLHESIEYHAQPNILNVAKASFWHPVGPLVFEYGEIERPYVPMVENWLIETRHPIFNIPRTAA